MSGILIDKDHPIAFLLKDTKKFPNVFKTIPLDDIYTIYPCLVLMFALIAIGTTGTFLFMLNQVSWVVGLISFLLTIFLAYIVGSKSTESVKDKKTAFLASLNENEMKWVINNSNWEIIAIALEKENRNLVREMFHSDGYLERLSRIIQTKVSKMSKIEAIKQLNKEFNNELKDKIQISRINKILSELQSLSSQPSDGLNNCIEHFKMLVEQNPETARVFVVEENLKNILFKQMQKYKEDELLRRLNQLIVVFKDLNRNSME